MMFTVLSVSIAAAGAQTAFEPFIPDGTYLKNVPSPESVLGFRIGSVPVRHHHIYEYAHSLEERSPRVKLEITGKTWQGRDLFLLFISNENNIENLDALQKSLLLFGDPRKTSPGQAEELAKDLPAVAWIMMNLHGNELSGSDAALQLAYQLAAGTDSVTEKILENTIVIIDPSQNPDGRERYLSHVEQWTGNMPAVDAQHIMHSGVWPGGRTNHYLFDMNRDWFIGSQSETKARIRALLKWRPQLVADGHEMGPYSTYFFNPSREPINPHIHPKILNWMDIFSADQAEAFDKHGWSYFTGDVFDDWYPGFGSSWPYYFGSVAILYEQARTSGSAVMLPDGSTLTFHQAVHQQFTSALANIKTVADNREEMLKTFYSIMRDACAKPEREDVQAYVILNGENTGRVNRLVNTLIDQGIEVQRITRDKRIKKARNFMDSDIQSVMIPENSYLIEMDQPLQGLIKNLLSFEVRLNNKQLEEERKSLKEGRGTRMYEIGAWSLPIAFNVETWEILERTGFEAEMINSIPKSEGKLLNENARYGYVFKMEDDNAIHALIQCFNQGLNVRAAVKDFKIGSMIFKRGACLLRRHENGDDLDIIIRQIAESSGIEIYGVSSARTDKGPDLGAGDFQLLAAPRTAIITGAGINTSQFGALWYLLDQELKLPHTVLNADRFERNDLRNYNVLIIPSGNITSVLGSSGIQKIKTWTQEGGTLIALADAAAALADSVKGLSQVRLRRNVLDRLEKYEAEIKYEQSIGKTKIDSLAIWEGADSAYKAPEKKTDKTDSSVLAKLDEKRRLFMPRGIFMRIQPHPKHWLGFGAGDQIPAMTYTANAFMSKRPVETAARYSDEKTLRISGLIWPEARPGWAHTAWAARERSGNGQIILFAGDPYFRAFTHGTGRMLINAILLGPGMGARQPVPVF
jgi:hypothetical protein